MTDRPLSIKQARAVALAAQGLLKRKRTKARKQDVLDTIRAMSALQIDTINVVARSPYLVLFSRLGNYNPIWLDQLLTERQIFEYWSHEACFLPIEDYPLYRYTMVKPEGMGWKYSVAWMKSKRQHVARVLDHIRTHGEVRSADFERTDGKAGGWWEWKTEKRALEMMFTAGELMIARRHNFQRVYDLRERILPDWNDRNIPSTETRLRALVLKAVRALGLCKTRWAADYFRTPKRETDAVVHQLASEGKLVQVEVKDWSQAVFVHPDNIELVTLAWQGRLRPCVSTLLSPFDPLVWDRARARDLFNFDYRLECYTPGPKRKFGYFTLPILDRDEIVGRLDAKAHRKDGIFEIKSIHFEPELKMSSARRERINAAIQAAADWHGTPTVRWERRL